jgi:NAD(P)-dependent dehydrogenase (short-subunit alcohol dehydrogenase family)
VVLAARSPRELDTVGREIAAAGGRALSVATDVRQEPAVAALVARTLAEHGRIDILVTAAGVARFGPVTEMATADWDQTLAVNLRGALLCCRAVLPPMMAARRGTIINIGSMVTSRTLTGSAAYTASKYGLLGFSRVLAEIRPGSGRRAVGRRHRHASLGHARGARPSANAHAGSSGRGGPPHGRDRVERGPRGADPVARRRRALRLGATSRPAPTGATVAGAALLYWPSLADPGAKPSKEA